MHAHTTRNHAFSISPLLITLVALLAGLLGLLPSTALASRTVTVPISVALPTDQQLGFPTFVMRWDEASQPTSLALRWGRSQVPVRGAGMGSIRHAFSFAVERLAPSIRPSGVLSLYATFIGPLSTEGSAAEARLGNWLSGPAQRRFIKQGHHDHGYAGTRRHDWSGYSGG